MNDILSAGHAFVLMQIDWPQEANLLSLTMERILTRGSFSYPLFQPYIICVDILEELTYLWSENGGGVLLDIKNGSGISQSKVLFNIFMLNLCFSNFFFHLFIYFFH